ncbi:MAG: AAA family ATPase, partial [Chloroflexi bacterium]|nr:AAA family ATPase [Chloroflexota bacterium]
MRGFGSGLVYFLNYNKKRLIILFLLLAFVVTTVGQRQLVEGVIQLIVSAPGLLLYLVFIAFSMVAQFGLLMWFMSRPRKYVVTPDMPQIGLSFDSYRGQPELLEYAKSLVRILTGVERFRQLGGELPKGMLLSGPPGTGKTFLAGVIAAEAKLPFIYVDASSLSSMFFGVDVLIVVQLFRQARGLGRKWAKPGHQGACILFIDELDSIGMSRSGVQGTGQGQMPMGGMGMFGYRGMALNTMLNQMDSLGQHIEDRWLQRFGRWLGLIQGPVPLKPVVFVIGATNRPDTLDAALTRPGRLDRRLNIFPPDGPGRRDIIQHYLAQKAHDPKMDMDLMVSDSIGWTPIEIKTIINEALIVAHDEGRDFLTYRDWLAARDIRQLGLKQPATMTADDRRAIAYHEAGHAIVGHYLRPEERILKASIIRRGETGGVVQSAEREERHTKHAREIETDIMMFLGSRAVEEEILKTKLTGASSDLNNATRLAMAYVGSLGMGASLLANVGGDLVQRQADSLLDQLYDETKRLVREKDYAVHAVAGALIERQELIGSELTELLRFAEDAHGNGRAPFVRKTVVLEKTFDKTGKTPDQLVAITSGEQSPGGPVPQP